MQEKDYVLYVYFPDKTDKTLVFNTSDDLNKVLLNCKIDKKEYNFTEEQKKEFIKHFGHDRHAGHDLGFHRLFV